MLYVRSPGGNSNGNSWRQRERVSVERTIFIIRTYLVIQGESFLFCARVSLLPNFFLNPFVQFSTRNVCKYMFEVGPHFKIFDEIAKQEVRKNIQRRKLYNYSFLHK